MINFNNIMQLEHRCEQVGLTIDFEIAKGFMVYQTGDPNGKAASHLHVFVTWNDDPPHHITSILPKWSNFRSKGETALTGAPLSWEEQCQDTTREIARLFGQFCNGAGLLP